MAEPKKPTRMALYPNCPVSNVHEQAIITQVVSKNVTTAMDTYFQEFMDV